MGAGLVLAAMAAGAFLSDAAARHLAARFGAPGTVLIGLGLEVAGVVALALLLGPDTSGWLVAVPLVVYGLGLGLASAQLTDMVLQDIPVQISGQGAATQSTVRQIGSPMRMSRTPARRGPPSRNGWTSGPKAIQIWRRRSGEITSSALPTASPCWWRTRHRSMT